MKPRWRVGIYMHNTDEWVYLEYIYSLYAFIQYKQHREWGYLCMLIPINKQRERKTIN